jgi:cystathionine beta-lyase family protein involved in aluminum resistance
MYKEMGISDETVYLVNKAEASLKEQFAKIDEMCDYNSLKVLNAFHKYKVSEVHFNSTTGYGYNDLGREVIEKVFSDVLGAEDCLFRGQFISGTHALTVALFAFLRPNDVLLSISGKPYDTLDEVIGITDNPSSLKARYLLKQSHICLLVLLPDLIILLDPYHYFVVSSNACISYCMKCLREVIFSLTDQGCAYISLLNIKRQLVIIYFTNQ